MKTFSRLLCGFMAGSTVAAAFTAVSAFGYAAISSSPNNPVPAQVVLNQTNVDDVPMVSDNPPQAPNIVSNAAVVMDMSTGTLVYAKNPNQVHYPASITKIMTAMLALQHGQLTDEITTSPNAVSQEPDKVYLVPGENEPLGKLLYGLLLISANDAAVAIAEHYGGSVAGFADMMNAEARDLGAQHTHFVNPNGLPNPNHVTTAYDMALITRAAMQYPEFRKIVDTKSFDWQGEKWQSKLTNLNSMLYYYPGSIGVKTGFTSVAHCTLVEAATRNNQTFLAVLMDAQSNVGIRQDAGKLLDYAFAHFQTQTLMTNGTIVGQVSPSSGVPIPVATAVDVLATTRSHDNLKLATSVSLDPVSRDLPKGARIGWMKVSVGEGQTLSVPLVLTQSLMLHPLDASANVLYTSMYWIVAFIGLIMVVILVYWIYKRRQLHRSPENFSSPSASL